MSMVWRLPLCLEPQIHAKVCETPRADALDLMAFRELPAGTYLAWFDFIYRPPTRQQFSPRLA